jgi:signal transduction histidine kinase
MRSVVEIRRRPFLLVSVIDLSQRLEEERHRHYQEFLLREMGRMAKIGGWELDPETGEGTWTEEAARIHDLEPSDRITVEQGLSFYEGASRKRIEQAVTDAVEHGTRYELELELTSDRGVRKWIRTIGQPVVEGGRVVQVRGSFQDITRHKRIKEEILRLNRELEDRVRERTAQLEAANADLEAFAYSVSHDLRAPLRAIRGFLEILLEDHGRHLGAEGERLCTIINDRARDMGALIDALLSLSRVGQAELKRLSCSMDELLRTAYHQVTTPEQRQRIDLRVSSLPPALGDPALLQLVWTNLLGNAVKFSAARSRPVIEVRSEHRDGEVEYILQDNGAGFDMRHADKLFTVFQRLHRQREFAGTGAGLAIVHRIVPRHGGRIRAEAEPDSGATFRFTLPDGDRSASRGEA